METFNVSPGAIAPSPTNPRKYFDEPKLLELAASIRSQGILQPILIRPAKLYHVAAGQQEGKDGYFVVRHDAEGKQVAHVSYHDTEKAAKAALPKWELVAGERRWRAAQLAELKVVPAIERDLSDKEVLLIQLVENDQREDVTPLERAQAYQNLLDAGESLEVVSVKVGKSISTLRGFLHLLDLSEKTRKALEQGKIVSSVAQLIGRIPDGPTRAEAEKFALTGPEWGNGQAPSYQRMKEYVAHHCMIELKRANFPRKELHLVEGKPDCESCPLRAGNLQKTEPENYSGLRADICTDPSCFRAKAEAWRQRVQAKAESEGHTVMSLAEQKRWFYDNDLAYNAPYVDLAEQCDKDTAKKKTPRSYKQLLEPHVEPKDIILAFDQESGAHRLVHKDVARPILLKEHAINLDSTVEHNADIERYQREQAKQKAKQDERKQQTAELAKQAAVAIAKTAEREKGLSLRLTRLLRELMTEVLDRLYGAEKQQLEKQLDIKGKAAGDRNDALLEHLKKMGPDDVWGTAAAMLAIYVFNPGNDSVRAKEIAEFLGVDMSASKPKQKAKAPKPKKKEAASA